MKGFIIIQCSQKGSSVVLSFIVLVSTQRAKGILN